MSQKLKAIYDALDHGNYKNALKLCSAFLQKQPAHALCKALQAVALERSGRRDEALQLCQEAAGAASGVDDTVLNTLQVVLRRCRQGPLMTQMYDAAWTREPENEEYAVALFFATVRDADLAKAQQVATKLYRKFNKPKYLHWVIVSILLQAEGGGSPKVLDLAEMMLKKAPVNMDVPKGDEEHTRLNRNQLYLLQLHLTTLRLQQKYTEALEMLEAGKGLVKLPADIAGLRIRLHAEAGHFEEAAAEARTLILRSADNWAIVQDYVQLAFSCPAPGGGLPTLSAELAGGERVEIPDHGTRLRPRDGGDLPAVATLEDVERASTDDRVWNALLLFRHLQQRGAASGGGSAAVRMARLAELELRRAALCLNQAALAQQRGHGEDEWKAAVHPGDLQDFVGAIVSYAEHFRHRSSCFFELKPFLCLLGEADAPPLLQWWASPEEAGPDAPLGAARLRRAFRRPRDDAPQEALLDDVQGLLRRWAAAKDGGGEPGGGTPHAQDDLLALAVATALDLDRKCSRSPGARGGGAYLLDALGLVEMGLAANPHAFQFKVLSVLLYGALGAPGAMMQKYNTMDIKNIQHESLSYLVLDVLCSSSCHDSLHEISKSITGFHEDTDKDGGDALSMAFNTGVVHRIPEYLASLERMGRSALWGRAVLEEVLCDLGQAQTWEAVTESIGRQSELVSMIAARPTDSWVLGNQDRCVLSSLHPLPLCTPLGASCHMPSTGGASAALPSMPVQSARSPAVISSALVWNTRAPLVLEAARPKAAVPASQGDLSALEELLGQRAAGSPARLRLTAALLQALRALLQREGPAQEPLAQALVVAREASAAEGGEGGGGSGDGGLAAAIAGLVAEDGAAAGAAPWSRVPARFARLAGRCALAACEAAQAVLQCAAGKEPWEQAEARLVSLAATVKASVEHIRGRSSGADGTGAGETFAPPPRTGSEQEPLRGSGETFALGGCGIPCLWAFLHRCTVVLIPVALWCCTAMPKAGSGKKAKEGQEALHAARVALRGLLAALQSGLAEVQEDLTAAQGSGGGGGLLVAAGGEEGLRGVPAAVVEGLPEFAKHREQARSSLLEWHRKHLQALRDAVGARLSLLKARGAFKP